MGSRSCTGAAGSRAASQALGAARVDSCSRRQARTRGGSWSTSSRATSRSKPGTTNASRPGRSAAACAGCATVRLLAGAWLRGAGLDAGPAGADEAAHRPFDLQQPSAGGTGDVRARGMGRARQSGWQVRARDDVVGLHGCRLETSLRRGPSEGKGLIRGIVRVSRRADGKEVDRGAAGLGRVLHAHRAGGVGPLELLRRQVGALIVVSGRSSAPGYNGTPVGVRNCVEGGCPRCASDAAPGDGYDACVCVHAEQNAIVLAARHGNATERRRPLHHAPALLRLRQGSRSRPASRDGVCGPFEYGAGLKTCTAGSSPNRAPAFARSWEP